jgi:hypothetical protein
MQSRREYAHSLGLAKLGRGKFSAAAKEAIAKAEAEGMRFSDSGTVVRVATPTGDAPAAPVRSDARASLYICPSDFRFPEGEWQAVAVIDGKRTVFGMRECCNTCRVSLTNHACASPSIHGNIAVTIEPRKKVAA